MTGTRPARSALAAAVTVLAVLAAGCSGGNVGDGEEGGGTGSPGTSAPATESPGSGNGGNGAPGVPEVVETVAEDLPTPWGMVELPVGGLLVASRDDATVSYVGTGTGDSTELIRLSGVDTDGEGGLLGLAWDGERLYAYHTAASDNRIVRMDYTADSGDPGDEDGPALGSPSTVLDGIPKDPVIHHGGALAFGPDGMLYAGTGDANTPELAQDPDSLGGKILRMAPDGEVPEDNPRPDSLVYSLGHRNVQGLAWDTQERLWASEFGARMVDELNLIEPDANYGWPQYEGAGGAEDGYTDPRAEWLVSEASPSGLAYADGALWMAALRGQRLWRIPVDEEGTTGEPEAFFEEEYGRLRNVLAVGPDELLLATNETDTRGTPEAGDDRVLRLRVG
jgi:glucose/arabinose dehydrogenase